MSCRTLVLMLLCCLPSARGQFPEFRAPGHEAEMARLGELYALHHPAAQTSCTLWDAWLPHATLWAAVGEPASAQARRSYYRGVLLGRRIDTEGYVSMQQHRGMAHSEGWPFPAWQQAAGGKGWHFSVAHETWAVQHFRTAALTDTQGWVIEGAEVLGIDPAAGLRLRLTNDFARLTTPAFSCGTIVAPFARLEWSATGLPEKAALAMEWLYQDEPVWPSMRMVSVPAPGPRLEFINVPLHHHPQYGGLLKHYRLRLDGARGAEITLKSLITAVDTRHPVTNPNYLQACVEYVNWTTDLPFLRENIARMRHARRYMIAEFGLRKHLHVVVPWVGHDGRTGLVRDAQGKRVQRHGLGVGNNYWDLLPFGGHDALATIYALDALRKFNRLEAEIAAHPEWSVPCITETEQAELAKLEADIARAAPAFFWNAETGRLIGWQDGEGKRHDYGFTFVNLEAVHYGFTTPEQSRSILDWVDGKRTVAGDTAQGADIYHWRFGPRATTRRNTEDYCWVWRSPEDIPWGGQVQDGGAVLGFAYFDLMARLKTNGPDDAWRRLRALLAWFDEVQRAGGYRPYYAGGARGTLQGGGTAGGLGMDHEFLESVLVPQVMLSGFLGAEPFSGGLRLRPRLPAGVPELTVTRVQAQGHVFDITARPEEIELLPLRVDGGKFRLAVGDRPAEPVSFTAGQAQRVRW